MLDIINRYKQQFMKTLTNLKPGQTEIELKYGIQNVILAKKLSSAM